MPKDLTHLAEQLAAQAVAEIVGAHFAHVPPGERAALMQSLRGPVVAAVWSFATHGKRLRRKYVSLRPSVN